MWPVPAGAPLSRGLDLPASAGLQDSLVANPELGLTPFALVKPLDLVMPYPHGIGAVAGGAGWGSGIIDALGGEEIRGGHAPHAPMYATPFECPLTSAH